MCGFAGFIDKSSLVSKDSWPEILQKMSDSIYHRGPDDNGTWVDDESGFAVAHQRLSIIDLSKHGHQPMYSSSGRYVIAYNGEIYNFLEIKLEIEQHGYKAWQGHSDTEVLLAAIEIWGFEKTLEKLNGMFAICLWDKQNKKLFLARDRMGEKPLYYGYRDGVFLFASELKAMTCHPFFKKDINRDALCSFLRFNYVPAPLSIYNNIYKLNAGCFAAVSLDRWGEVLQQSYWSVKEKSSSGFVAKSDEEVIAELEKLISESVKKRMISDVDLGAFLSGGIDSSLISAMMQKNSSSAIRTFTIGFEKQNYNEAKFAKQIADHLKTNHTELYVTAKDALSIIPEISHIYDEPFADSSQVPTFMVSKLTRKHVKVCLSGDGGDELFFGYSRYLLANNIWQKINKIPAPIRNIASLLPSRYSPYLQSQDIFDVYLQLRSHWKRPENLVISGGDMVSLPDVKDYSPNMFDALMRIDMLTYLPDDILVKIDRATMAASLEGRVPLLDHNIVEYALNLPFNYKYREGKGKWILRKILAKYVPEQMFERPKMGFGVPIDSWLRGPLKPWAEELLSEEKLKQQGFFNPKEITKKWNQHKSGKFNWHYYIWDILMFQSWYENIK